MGTYRDHLPDAEFAMMHNWSDGWLGYLWMALFWAAILAVVYAIVRSLVTPRGSGVGPTHDPYVILDERFARGDLSPEEYAERRRVLHEARHEPGTWAGSDRSGAGTR